MKLTVGKHDEQHLFVRTTFDPSFNEAIRAVKGRRWNPELRVWLLPYTLRALEQFMLQFKRADVEIESALLDECASLQEWAEEGGKALRLRVYVNPPSSATLHAIRK